MSAILSEIVTIPRPADPRDAKTRELPRPQFRARPLPRGWAFDDGGMIVHMSLGFQVENPSEIEDADLSGLETLGYAIAELAAWARNERDVVAQLEDYHRAILDDIALHGPGWPTSDASAELEAWGLLTFRDDAYHLTPAGLSVVSGGLR